MSKAWPLASQCHSFLINNRVCILVRQGFLVVYQGISFNSLLFSWYTHEPLICRVEIFHEHLVYLNSILWCQSQCHLNTKYILIMSCFGQLWLHTSAKCKWWFRESPLPSQRSRTTFVPTYSVYPSDTVCLNTVTLSKIKIVTIQ